MIQQYNKLVRDNIPEIIIADNCTPITRILSDEEYKIELEKKLYEEYLKEPNSHKAHELLHTHYSDKFKNSYKDLV